MADESYSFNTARTRLEDIVSEVRKKDTSLEKSLDLLEEGVRLANACTELIDRQDWTSGTQEAGDPTAAQATADDAPIARAATGEANGATGEAAGEVADEVAAEAGPSATDAISAQTGSADDAVPQFGPAPEFFDADDVWADESETVPAEEVDDPALPEG